MQAFLRKFNKSFPSVRDELAEFQMLLKQLERIERLAQKGKLDKKALRAIDEALPKEFKGLHLRAVASATEKKFIPNTIDVLLELNRVIKDRKPRNNH